MHFSCRFYKKLNNNKQHAAAVAAKSATLAERLKAGNARRSNVQRATQTQQQQAADWPHQQNDDNDKKIA